MLKHRFSATCEELLVSYIAEDSKNSEFLLPGEAEAFYIPAFYTSDVISSPPLCSSLRAKLNGDEGDTAMGHFHL